MTGDQHPQTEQPINAPLVVFCSKCRAIVGDSYSWLGADAELRTFSLYDKSAEVRVDEDLETSKSGFDIGSTFTKMHCSNCESWLGRVYKTTPRALDHIRDMFTFSVDQVSLYQLGPAERSTKEYDLTTEDRLDLPSISKLQDNMRKAQSLICFLNERINQLESQIPSINIDNGVSDPNIASTVPAEIAPETSNQDFQHTIDSEASPVKGVSANSNTKVLPTRTYRDNKVKRKKMS